MYGFLGRFYLFVFVSVVLLLVVVVVIVVGWERWGVRGVAEGGKEGGGGGIYGTRKYMLKTAIAAYVLQYYCSSNIVHA